ncbi:L-threonine O-3-phosphate decarboxylase [Thalassoporum mexicanum PCC 7367]|uniref:threonine-phosphate decarboxylase CobD n=1 Tax=Thalassoporum mexicanum TaxID=3457544 RepID=UPI00029FBE8A|nr:threonine-phosphate decarboxylase CobD [Pseudanabaena sp. PCC 7367]AFY69090.1 L-threonine O-3-phosphate decarboxylase [Pseudanabaena sp. PCC 7367]
MPIDRANKFVPRHGGNLDWAATVAGCDRGSILDFSASINPLGCPEKVIEMLRSPEIVDLIRRYPDPAYKELRQAIANDHHIEPDWIMPGNGAAELITWLGREFAETVSQVQLIVPAFGDYLRALRSAGAEVEKVSSLNDLIAAANLNQSDHHGNLGLLLNNPHNPSGEMYSRDRLLEILPRYKLVAIDEAFMDFLPDHESQSLLDQVKNYPNLVILRSLTKFYALPGLRIGYGIANPQLLTKWQQWRDPWSVNLIAQQAAIASLADHNHRQKTWQWLPPARSQLFTGLNQIAGLSAQPGAANYLLVKSAYSVLELRNRLLQQARILIRDCHSFPELGDRYFRVCVRTKPENELLINALDQIVGEFV